jgi:hypothetical protein
MTGPTLHITNGDAAAAGIRRATGEEVVPWRDVLHDGPVPALDDATLRRVRAEFLGSAGRGEVERIRGELEARDALVAEAARTRRIVLWFEPDLYDQLQLLQVMDLLERAVTNGRYKIDLVEPPTYLGGLTPDELAGLRRTARAVTGAHLEVGRRAWAAFRAPVPDGWEAFAARDDLPFEFLAGAVRRHLEEYPAIRTGLARSESQIMRTAVDGPVSLSSSFRATQAMEEWIYLGDWSFVDIVRELARPPHPLLLLTPVLERALRGNAPLDHAAWDETISLTAEGTAVLAGDIDRVALRGIDRWLGGVHLLDRTPWRWTGERLTTAAA